MRFRSTNKLKWRETPLWFRIVWVVAIANFASFWIIAVASGGDALNGREINGHYFLANHGRLTEVSRAFFEYSRLHTLSVFITHPIALLSAFWVAGRKERLAEHPIR